MPALAGDSDFIPPVPILESPYPTVAFPAMTTKSAVEFILRMAEKNVQCGRTNWTTNTITGETLKFSDVEPMSRIVASAMHKKGMGKGDIALYLTSDVTKIYTVIMGVWRVGGCMYSSYLEDTDDTLLMRIKEGNAKWVFCDPISVPQVKVAIQKVDWNVEIIVFGESEGCTSVSELFEDEGNECPDPSSLNTELHDPVLILCTSGTTGKSKGAVYTHRSLLGFCLGTSGIPRSDQPAILLLRCTHVLGVLFPIRNICTGSWAVMMHQVTKESIFKAVDQYKPDFAFGFPTFLILLAIDPEAKKYDRSSLKTVCTGGMVINAQFYQAMMTLPNMRAVFNGYGMTEVGALSTTFDLSGTTDIKPLENIPHLSVGHLYPNTSLKVLDMDTGKPVGANQRGELAFRSPIMCTGYWNRPEETSTVFQDGWMRTGDLGYYDENGFVFVIDRIKETFKYFNNHISPAEIEEILVEHPAIREASVFGIPDPAGGDHIPRALVVLKPGKEATSDEIRTFTDGRVAEYKKLRGGVYIVSALPRGKTGKIVRSMAASMEIPRIAY